MEGELSVYVTHPYNQQLSFIKFLSQLRVKIEFIMKPYIPSKYIRGLHNLYLFQGNLNP